MQMERKITPLSTEIPDFNKTILGLNHIEGAETKDFTFMMPIETQESCCGSVAGYCLSCHEIVRKLTDLREAYFKINYWWMIDPK